MTTLRQYKPLPDLSELNPCIDPGWRFDVLILQAEPVDRVGSIILANETKEDEKAASVEALLVAVSPTAFKQADWVSTGLPCPYQAGDHVFTKRYPAGAKVTGADGREYMIVADEEIRGKRTKPADASVLRAA